MAADRLFVNNKDESPRMFKSDFLDLFSRVHWSVPLILWGPVVLVCLYYAFGVNAMPLGMGALVFLSAIFAWTFSEYVLHRFVFHYQPTSKIGQRIHFIAHGVHHDFPNDSKRLVMPPALSLPLSVFFFSLFYFTMGAWHLVFFAGFVTGYLMYDMTHYATHHAKWNNPLFKRLKEYHMRHHYLDPDKGYGVSMSLWDVVFGTTFKDKK